MKETAYNMMLVWCIYAEFFGLILAGAAFEMTDALIHLIMSFVNSNV